jgi:hypothetical protein
MDAVFTAISSEKIAHLIEQAVSRIILVSPALFENTAKAIVSAQQRLGMGAVSIVVDCDEEVFRLGYGEIKALQLLRDNGIVLRQCSGLRIGILICDDRGWVFSPTALYVQPEVHSNETPNAVCVSGEEVSILASRIGWIQDHPSDSKPECLVEIGNSLVSQTELQDTQDSLEVAPPVAFDIARQVRVFQPYIQYVEINLKGCSFQRMRIKIPKSIQVLQSKEIENRLQTTFDLIENSSDVSSKRLEAELKQIRDDLTRSLGKPWGRVILKSVRKIFDANIYEFLKKLDAHKDKVNQDIEDLLQKSKQQVAEYYLPMLVNKPPASLCGQLPYKPSKDDVRNWLTDELDNSFPKAHELVSDMDLDIQFRDVTFETLNDPGFYNALCRAYPRIDWDKPFDDFNAAKEKPKP